MQRREQGFSIVEVVIAALLLAVVVVGATALFGGSQKSASLSKVRDQQAALANQTLTKLQADPSWTKYCRSQPDPMACDLAGWLDQSDYDELADLGPDVRFQLVAKATGTDLPADGLDAADKDGFVPDVYKLAVSVVPTGDLSARYPTLKAFSVQAEYNPSVRLESGRVTVDACRAVNQVDERMPVGSCNATTGFFDALPPPSLDTSSASAIANTCDGPVNARNGSDERDCVAFKCADAEIAAPDPGLVTPCSSFPGWAPPTGLQMFFTKVVTEPVTGSITLRNTASGQQFGPVSLNQGRADFRDLPIGEYEVITSVPGGDRLWRSKSVPSRQVVTVEAGINSRAVLLFRPRATGFVTVPVRSVDSSIPWSPVQHQGWVGVDNDGNVQESSAPEQICLVPVPQGRLAAEDIPCQDFTRESSTTEFRFTDVEPGLYSAQLSRDGYTTFMSINGSAGFIWISEDGPPITTLTNDGTPFEYVAGLCAKNVRDSIVGTTTNPVTGQAISPVQPCNSGGGGVSVGGGGGGGAQ
jgi:hypothetical protein